MSSALKNVIIIGAGGTLGSAILSAFTADPRFNVSILSRTSSKSTFPSHVTVHRVGDDYPEAELLAAFKGQDAIISAMATAGAAQQHAIIDVAIKAGVKRFVPSEFGSDNTENANALALLPQFYTGKRKAVEYLISKEKEGLTWSSFITGPFFEQAVQGYMGFDLKAHKATIYNDGNVTWSGTRFKSVGLAVKNAMLKPDQTANKYIYISSFNVTQNQILASLEKATGAKWEVEYVDGEEQKKIGLEKMSKFDFSGAVALLRYVGSVHGYGGNYAEYTESSNELLEVPKENLDDVIAEIVKG